MLNNNPVIRNSKKSKTTSARRLIIYSAVLFIVIVAAGSLLLKRFMASMTDSIDSYRSITTLMFILMVIVIALVFVVFNLLVAAFRKSLWKSMDKADAAIQAKTVFIANMGHEIRTPLNAIMGFSELAADGKVSPKTRDYLGKIHSNTEKLLQFISDALDISKIESGKMDLESIPFDLHDLISSCRTYIMPKAMEKGLLLHFYAEPSIGKMPLGDPARLRQVLINLLTNAVKFTNAGMIKLHAAINDSRDKTVTIHFEVKDSGIGMTDEQIRKIYEPFTRVDTSTTRKYGSTGLSLVITKNIIEKMGGEFIIDSTPGIGSKFSFDLTFDTIAVFADDMFGKETLPNEIEKPTFEGEILLCEDNAMNQQVICEHLAKVGLKTVVADNGLAGVEMVQGRKEKGEKQFDLIFMDMHMPIMDGLEAAEKIIEFKTGVPIVAMTANMMSDDREIYRMSGMHDCVGKPFTSQELWRCLLKYFKPLSLHTIDENQMTQIDNELMEKLIISFVQDNRTRYKDISQAINTGNLKLAHRLVHSLKGNAGQLGKTLLQQAAGDVEHHLEGEKNLVTPHLMMVLETELKAVLAEFEPLVNETFEAMAAAESEPLDIQSTRELLINLELMLEKGNPECREYINSLRRIKAGKPEADALKTRLIQQMEDYDFEQAFVTITELKKIIV